MKIKTDSGNIIINEHSAYGRFVKGYIASGAFSGNSTLSAAWTMAKQIKARFNSIKWFDIGKLVGANFKHKPSDAYLEELTGVKMERY